MRKNEISSGVDIDNFDPIVLSLYPEEYLDSQVKTFETEKLILLDGLHRWKYANKENSVNKLNDIKSQSVILKTHTGLGDQIILNGLVNEISSDFKEIYLPVDPKIYDVIKFSLTYQ